MEEADIDEATKETTYNLPEQSKQKYEQTYSAFMIWHSLNKATCFSEKVLLDYFDEMSTKYKAASLWTKYSMLRSTLNLNHNVQIDKYLKLRAFLKHKSIGVEVKKTKTFTPEQINTFIREAPDDTYLATKVALIIGIMGACRAQELHSMSVEDIEDLGSIMIVTVPKTKTKIVRQFTVSGNLYEICKKYTVLRPKNISTRSYFLNYQNGKCTIQNIGINKFGRMGQQIAKYLNLSDAKLYTGHCFRRSSALLLVDGNGDILTVKRHLWKAASVNKSSAEQMFSNRIAEKMSSVINNATTSTESANESLPDESETCDSIKTEIKIENDDVSYENESLDPLHPDQMQIDTCSIYGEEVASRLRDYSEETRGVVQTMINNILNDADLGYYDTKYCTN